MDTRAALLRMRDAAREELTTDILPYWSTVAVDEARGGFHGVVSRENVPDLAAPKGAILNARILWTFSCAYRVLGDARWLDMARRAFDYFERHFWDEQNAGVYLSLTPEGAPLDDVKMTYAQAFAVYALSEYRRATGDAGALAMARRLFGALDAHARDGAHGGYFEIFTRDWQPCPDRAKTPINHDERATKTMNTSLHMLEALTCLLRVWDDAAPRARAREMIDLFRTRIMRADTRHQAQFFTDDWTVLPAPITYGHDIEAAWLIDEALCVYGDNALLRQTLPALTAMAEACMLEGILPDGSMLSDIDPRSCERVERRVWWVECEAVVGLLNAWQRTREARYLAASENCLRFIRERMCDRVYGEWLGGLDERGERPVNVAMGKVGPWKAPYHNGRMCMEIIERCDALLA